MHYFGLLSFSTAALLGTAIVAKAIAGAVGAKAVETKTAAAGRLQRRGRIEPSQMPSSNFWFEAASRVAWGLILVAISLFGTLAMLDAIAS